jgi:acetyl-CoA synthetase
VARGTSSGGVPTQHSRQPLHAPDLPKTRSGKIMRRRLRKIAADEHNQLGDTSTLADPAVVDDLVGNRQNRAGA